MNVTWLPETLALGTLTGMRSMTGAAVLARRAGGPRQYLVGILAAGEMLLDKTTLVGNRTDPLPLAGRAVIGALIGGVIARRALASILAGGLAGAAAAVAAAHLAFHARKRLPAGAVGGLIEDAAVLMIAGVTTREHPGPGLSGRCDVAASPVRITVGWLGSWFKLTR